MVQTVRLGVPRVLLVEDSLPVRDRIRSLIEESCPAKVVGEAGTVAAALALFHALRPDAVVLDLHLDGEDGCAVLTEVKRASPTCVVIVLTAFSDDGQRARCTQMGADFFFDKMTDFERVPEALTWFEAPVGTAI